MLSFGTKRKQRGKTRIIGKNLLRGESLRVFTAESELQRYCSTVASLMRGFHFNWLDNLNRLPLRDRLNRYACVNQWEVCIL